METELLLQELNEKKNEVKVVLESYTDVYNALVDKLSNFEETDQIKEVKKKALENLIKIESEYKKIKHLIKRAKGDEMIH